MRTWGLLRTDMARDIAALAGVLVGFPEATRSAFGAAATGATLSRHSWDNCPFRRAGEQVGERVVNVADAVRVFGLPPWLVHSFVGTWDDLCGSNRYCTEVLRQALRAVAEARAADSAEPAAPPELIATPVLVDA